MTSREAATTLPPLSAEEGRHSAQVLAALGAAITAAGGWLPFDDFMRIALYAPGLGYYSAGTPKIGAAGDFVTAPEISALFSRCLARQCAELLGAVGGGEVLELGAGTGRMAADLLLALDALAALPQRYAILEVSAELRERQRATLSQLPAALAARVCWLDALPAVPLQGVILANEVADALPFQRFAMAADAVLELGVTLQGGQLVEAARAARPALRIELERLAPHWPVPYRSEVCPLQGPWLRSLADCLRQGAVILIDYGLPRHEYYHPQRAEGTLRCHFRHRAHADALRHPGLQDISAWVDFTRLAEAAIDAGLEVSGYCTQAAFLLASGIEAELAAAPDTIGRARLAAQARALLLPEEMGETFKVLALTRAVPGPLLGFTLQDLRRSL